MVIKSWISLKLFHVIYMLSIFYAMPCENPFPFLCCPKNCPVSHICFQGISPVNLCWTENFWCKSSSVTSPLHWSKAFCAAAYSLQTDQKRSFTCRWYVHNTYYSLLLFVCITGFSSSASSRTDVTHTNRIPRLGEVCSTVLTELYHSTNAVPATGGRCTQNKSCWLPAYDRQ